jgi:hypothetical protein
MKKRYVREIKHIYANYSLRKNATGYNINSKSIISKIIRDLIKLNWVDCKCCDGQFLFVTPSNNMKEILRKSETENKATMVLSLNKNLILNNNTLNLKFKSPAIIAA